jgi:sulfatase modifying factor 1
MTTITHNAVTAGCSIWSGSVSQPVLVPAGYFLMGSESGGEFERPIHEVYLDDYYIDEAPVTNDQFATFIEQSGYVTESEKIGLSWGYQDHAFTFIQGLSWRTFATESRKNHPVVSISWNDAASYANWANKRLPTEAEWEKAARGGLSNAEYPWGNHCPDGTQSPFARIPSDIPPTAPVKAFPPNGYGLYDMVGNVWQWCADWYSDDYYQKSPDKNPTGPGDGKCRVRRGGAWNVLQAFRLRTTNRGALEACKSAPNIGFRCCT